MARGRLPGSCQREHPSMNPDFDSLVRALGLPSTVADCAAGRIRLPLGAMRSPAEWYGFPPVLIPIWRDGSGPNYIGVWKHWFTDRPVTHSDSDSAPSIVRRS